MEHAAELSDSLKQRLERCNSLPSLPAAAARVVELGRDPNASMKDVADAVTSDPALAAKVLRMANSPLYARRRRCESFQQALVMLGLNATLTLALTFSLVTGLRENTRAGLDYGRLWRRSLLAATAARIVAEHLGARDSEEAFLCGLLQDIGLMALDRACPDLYADLTESQQDHESIITLERNALGCDHARVGGWLLEKWNIDERLRHVVESSHRSGVLAARPDAEASPLASAVSLSGPIADLWMSAAPVESVDVLKTACSRLEGMDTGTITALVEQVADAVPEVEQMFDMQVADPRRSEWIMEEAREVIAMRNLQMVEESVRLQQVATTLQAQAKVLEEKTRTDNLTGTFNRGHLDEVLEEWFVDAGRTSIPLSLVFIDLDNFKNVNDRYGHQLGDEVLVRTGRVLLELARASDLVARYGGEEFVMLLPGCDAAGARQYCSRVLRAFRSIAYPLKGGERLVVTVSMGVATHGGAVQFGSSAELLRCADEALYQAKQAGKDRFVEHGVKSHAA